jgi:RNA polymerase-binding protein DksA
MSPSSKNSRSAKSKAKTPQKKSKIHKPHLKKNSAPANHKAPVRKTLRINPAFRELLKELQNRRNKITGQVDHLEHDLREDLADTQSTPGDVADHGSGELNQHISVTLMENDRIEMERIEQAIERIQSGKYGQCDICHKTIPMARLKAIPWTTRCINCQSRLER